MTDPLAPVRARLASGGEVRLGGLGDSLTQGWMVRRSFFDLACDAIAARFPAARVERRNAGMPGDTADGGLGRLPTLLAWRPDVVVVEFGFNDAVVGIPAPAFGRRIEAIGEAVSASGGLPVPATACPVAVPEVQVLVRPLWAQIREVARRRGWPLADLEAHWLRALSTGRAGPGLHLGDGVHPNQEGHALLARGLLEALVGSA